MNLVLFEPHELQGTEVVLEGRRANHIRSVHRASEGTTLRAGMIGGRIGSAVVLEVQDERVRLRIESMDVEPPAPLPVVLVLALPRPKVVNRTLAAAASLGIKQIEIINAWRVEKSYWSTPRLAPERIREQLIPGLEQAVDTVLPVVRTHRFFRRWAEVELPLIAAGDPVLVAHPHTAAEPVIDRTARKVLVVGPEGGFIEDELRLLRDLGAQCFRAGSRILRVETAVPWLVAKITTVEGGPI